jgi:hypothetical protein
MPHMVNWTRMKVTLCLVGVRTARRLRGLGPFVRRYRLRALAIVHAFWCRLAFHLCSPVETLL